MELKTQLTDALKESMKAGDEVRKRTVRMVLAAIKQAEVDRQITLDEPAILSILQKEIKTRKEALEEARRPTAPTWSRMPRPKSKCSIHFLPAGLSADEVRAIVQAAIAETGAASRQTWAK